MRTVSAGSHFLWTAVLEGSKIMWTVLAEAKYDGQFQQDVKIGGLVVTLAVQV